ncbi:MAG: pyrroloquinoline quinone precursor peptide PqqA, partial [Acidobacteriota bacterium]|nr:pyrroloquinoline quinone precursor peptide PqqA [Acidobacteriota bacterium]
QLGDPPTWANSSRDIEGHRVPSDFRLAPRPFRCGSIADSSNWLPRGDRSMTWETPQVEEICLSCEINTYSNGDF